MELNQEQKLILTKLAEIPSLQARTEFHTPDQLHFRFSWKLFYLIIGWEFESYFMGAESVIFSLVNDQVPEKEIHLYLSEQTFRLEISPEDANHIYLHFKNLTDLYQLLRIGWDCIKNAAEITNKNSAAEIVRHATCPGDLLTTILAIQCEDILSVSRGYKEINIRKIRNLLYETKKFRREPNSVSADKPRSLKLKRLETETTKLLNHFQFKSVSLLQFCEDACCAKAKSKKDALTRTLQEYKKSFAETVEILMSAGHPRKKRKTQVWDRGILRNLI